MTSRSDDLMFRGLSGRAGCPKCGGGDGSLRVRIEDWGFCENHGCRWLIGYGSSMTSTADRFADEVEGAAFLLAYEEVAADYGIAGAVAGTIIAAAATISRYPVVEGSGRNASRV